MPAGKRRALLGLSWSSRAMLQAKSRGGQLLPTLVASVVPLLPTLAPWDEVGGRGSAEQVARKQGARTRDTTPPSRAAPRIA